MGRQECALFSCSSSRNRSLREGGRCRLRIISGCNLAILARWSVRQLPLPWILFEKSWLWVDPSYVVLSTIDALKPHIYVFVCVFLAPCYVTMPSLWIRATATQVIFSIIEIFVEIFFSRLESSCNRRLQRLSVFAYFLWGEFPGYVCYCIHHSAHFMLVLLFCRWSILNLHLFSTCWATLIRS